MATPIPYARIAGPGVAVAGFDPDAQSYDHAVTQQRLKILSEASDAQGRKLQLVVLEEPMTARPQFESEYFAAG